MLTPLLAACVLAGLQPPSTSTVAAIAGGPPEARVERARLMAWAGKLPPKRCAAGDAEHVAGLVATQDMLEERVREMGYKPERFAVRYSKRPTKEAAPNETPGAPPAAPTSPPAWCNLVWQIDGQGAGEQILLIGAHFDAVANSPGADDNATGVATVLELARVLKDVPVQRTVRFVLFNHEEVGLYGSRQYAVSLAKEMKEKKQKLVGMVSVEMVGFYSNKPGSQNNPFKGIPDLPDVDVGDFAAICGSSQHRSFVRGLAEAMRQAEPACKTLVLDLWPNEQMVMMPPDLLRSDHQQFVLMNMPAVMISDTANFRNPHYHQPSDTPETLNPEMFTRTVRALAGAVHRLAGPIGPDGPVKLVDLSTPKAGAPAAEKPDGKPEMKPEGQ